MKYLLTLALLLAPILASAATFEGLLLTTNPEVPGPGDRVTITATRVGGSANDSVFTWRAGGEVRLRGAGADQLAIDAPRAGESLLIDVSTDTGERGTLTLRSAEVTIEWEGRTVRPPFYIGKPHAVGKGDVVAVAIPSLMRANGTRMGSADIQYTWKVDGAVQTRQSGYGRNTISLTPPFFNNAFNLSVTATSRDGSLSAADSVVIAPRDAEIVVYELSPLAGLRVERAVVGEYPFVNEEVAFRAYPLAVQNANAVQVAWTLNDRAVAADVNNPYLAVFRKTGSGSGSYSIGVTLESATNFLESAAHSFLLTF